MKTINIKFLYSASAVNGHVEIVGTRGDPRNITVVKIPFGDFVSIYKKLRCEAAQDKEAADARIEAFERAEG